MQTYIYRNFPGLYTLSFDLLQTERQYANTADAMAYAAYIAANRQPIGQHRASRGMTGKDDINYGAFYKTNSREA